MINITILMLFLLQVLKSKHTCAKVSGIVYSYIVFAYVSEGLNAIGSIKDITQFEERALHNVVVEILGDVERLQVLKSQNFVLYVLGWTLLKVHGVDVAKDLTTVIDAWSC